MELESIEKAKNYLFLGCYKPVVVGPRKTPA
jgi:hypothetical protein